ncbi:MAG: hypothetical protein GY822_18250 [Deltaproteobacteria bacterium]|nr:hypothetical protein [Deltaproteobacteria bacterium]
MMGGTVLGPGIGGLRGFSLGTLLDYGTLTSSSGPNGFQEAPPIFFAMAIGGGIGGVIGEMVGAGVGATLGFSFGKE